VIFEAEAGFQTVAMNLVVSALCTKLLSPSATGLLGGREVVEPAVR
jgi:hypothetical protein